MYTSIRYFYWFPTFNTLCIQLITINSTLNIKNLNNEVYITLPKISSKYIFGKIRYTLFNNKLNITFQMQVLIISFYSMYWLFKQFIQENKFYKIHKLFEVNLKLIKKVDCVALEIYLASPLGKSCSNLNKTKK